MHRFNSNGIWEDFKHEGIAMKAFSCYCVIGMEIFKPNEGKRYVLL